MRPVKRRRIVTNRENRADGENEPEQVQAIERATVIEEADVVTVTFGGDTEDELEDELDEDDEAGAPTDTSPLTTRVLLRYYNNLYQLWSLKIENILLNLRIRTIRYSIYLIAVNR